MISRKALICAAAAVALATFAELGLPEPAHAQFGGIANAIINHALSGHYRGGGCGSCGRHRRSHEKAEDEASSKSRDDRDKDRSAKLTPPAAKVQNELLHEIAVLNVEILASNPSDVTTKSISPVGKAVSKQFERDWTKALDDILKKLRKKQDDRVSTAGDVTQHAIEQSLDAAMKKARLDRFESFLGENFTNETLRWMVLDIVSSDIDTLFNGNSRGYARMQDVDSLIQNAAKSVYARLFELSELMAANRGSALFVHRLYQTHGIVPNELRDRVNEVLSRAAMGAAVKFEAALRQSEDGYALRYRAQRIVFDCLSDSVEKISSSQRSIAEKGEVEQRIRATIEKQCVPWIENQFGGDLKSLKPQQPVPLRVVWSATGPKDDPSMYGQATNEHR